jgi:hypothetical protein
MIDAFGNLLITAAAYPKPVDFNHVPQSPEEQAAQVRARIAQLTTSSVCDGAPVPHCGRESATLLAVVPWNPTDEPAAYAALAADPVAAYNATAADRLAACNEHYLSSPLAYTTNPAQLTAPTHGTAHGFVAYTTTSPPAGYDAITINSPVNLRGIQELWFTVETAPAGTPSGMDFVDPVNRGPIYLQGVPTPGGNYAIHFDLTPLAGSSLAAAGTALLYVDLDQDPVQF